MVKIYRSRVIPALKHINGPDILDIGCVGMGDNDVYGGLDFIFGQLRAQHQNVIGIDINKAGAQEPYDLGRKFDTVVSEENIEHISDLKTYLENVRKHLKPGGRFVMSTPNAMCLDFIMQSFIWGKPRVNHYHTHVHTLETITYLLKVHGLNVVHHEYVQAIGPGANLNARIMKWIVRWFPARFARTIILVAEAT
jgi:2-polyprenyl-3-methyl-5-hydroxy-6-metoxy-1,4-benzoquinol methylase